MKHMGVLDASVNPMVDGGLTSSHIEALEGAGWRRETTRYDVKNADVVFAARHLPAGSAMRTVDIPAGTAYIFNPDDGDAVLVECGNPTCWRYLI